MKNIIDLLHEGNLSCVISNNDEIRTFDRKGVIDIYELYYSDPAFLKGAAIADKIVGTGAATLMIAGKISGLYTDIISENALKLLKKYGIETECNTVVPYIINRTKTGGCPLETLCGDCEDVDLLLPVVDRFIESVRNNMKP